MYNRYKIVVNTAVGRRRYLKLLIPQIVSSDIVDRYDLWVNTLDKVDIAFFEALAKEFPKINLIWQPEGVINGIYSMAAFYPFCCEDKTIYIKMDDDIAWIDPNFFNEICDYRIKNPDYFLVSPLVINNGICNYILYDKGYIDFKQYVTCQGYDIRFYNGYLAEQLHNWFLDNYLIPGNYNKLYCGESRIAMQRFAINAVAWFGETFQKFGGKVTGDDEEFLTVKYPVKENLLCSFDCNTIVSHFSFSVQRNHLDSTNILDRYHKYLLSIDNHTFHRNLIKIENILKEVESNKEKILALPLPHDYKPGTSSASKYKKFRQLVNFGLKCLRVPKYHRDRFGDEYLNLIREKRSYF